jgi:hypothetical protein
MISLAAVRYSDPKLRTLALFATVLACSIRELPTESATDGSEPDSTGTTATTAATLTTTTTSDPPSPTTSTTSTTTPPSPSTTAGETAVDDTGQTFVSPPDVSGANDCDGWLNPLQDCPEGQKCTIEGSVSDTQCVDIVDDPSKLFEPCKILEGEGMFSGHDDCDAGLICWNVDPDTGIGQCIELCHGPIDNPSCPSTDGSCTLCQDCVVGFCLPICDPLNPNCPDGQVCVPNLQDFACVIDASREKGQVFDPCEFVNFCDPGLWCANSELAEECDPMTAGCCLPFCDLSVMPPTCPGAGQQCLPWFEEGQAPNGLEHVGVCGLPQ